jgi:RNase P/RNase MRP subunit p29
MLIKNLLLSFTLMLLCAGISSAASKMWVHVHVEDSAKEETVKINLPISVIETMLPIIQEKQIQKGHINFNDSDLRVEDLRKVWNDIRDEGDMEFVSVEGHDGNVRVYIEGNFLLVQPEQKSKNSKVDIRIPLKVVDAILSGKGNELNLTAAVKALRDSGVKDIITVKDNHSSVRVWIDDKNQVK